MRSPAIRIASVVLLLLPFTFSCKGALDLGPSGPVDETPTVVDEPHVDEEGDVEVDVAPDAAPPVAAGARRLTYFEYDNALADLLGDEARPAATLTEPTETTFGNTAVLQTPSGLLVESAEVLALQAAETALADEARRAELVACEPSGPADETCLEEFIRDFALRALRRPITDEEVADLLEFSAYGAETSDFYYAAKMVVRALLQHSEFLYRIEDGRPVAGEPGLFVLDDYEIASRMSFLLWGSVPDDELLQAAADGALSTTEERRAQARRMVWESDEGRRKTVRRAQQFHALWLGYERSQFPDVLGSVGRAETDELIEALLFERKRPWTELFTHEQTYINTDLADHYGFDYPEDGSGFVWFDYPDDSGRAGILSHAMFLNSGTKIGETSPTMRGLFVLRRLMCGNVAPPPTDVNVDEVPLGLCEDGTCVSPNAVAGRACETNDDCPEELACMSEHSRHYLETTSCAGCHQQMDPIGLGLENYDAFGRYRDFEYAKTNLPEGEEQPDCAIDGAGALPNGLGDFSGPAELGRRLVESGELEPCMTRHFYQFAFGQEELPVGTASGPQKLHEYYQENDRDLIEAWIDFVADEDFTYRRDVAER